MYCAKCGKELSEGMNFCPYCGASVLDAPAASAAAPAAPAANGPAPAAASAAAPAAEEPTAGSASESAEGPAHAAVPTPVSTFDSTSAEPTHAAPAEQDRESDADAGAHADAAADAPEDVFPIFGGAAAAAGAKFSRAGADQAKPSKKKRHGTLVGLRNCVLVVIVALLSGILVYSGLAAYRGLEDSSTSDDGQEESSAATADADAADDADATGTDASTDVSDLDASAEETTTEAVFVGEIDDVAEGANEPTYTYTYSQIYQAVTLTATLGEADSDGPAQDGEVDADSAENVQTTEATWSYPQFITTDGQTTDALDLVNAALAAAYESALAASENWVEAEATSAQTLAHTDTVASLSGSYVSIRRYTYVTYWGTHGSESVTGLFFDLSTGEQVEPAEALGFAVEELEAMATEAIYTYLESDESFTEDYFIDAEGTDAATLIAQAVAAIVADTTRYYVTDDAIVICTAPYELGDYSFGMQEIVIYAYTDAVTVGQAVGYGTN